MQFSRDGFTIVSQLSESSEIKFLDDYLDLEKMRRDAFEYSFNYVDSEIRNLKIAPNILLVLVENAIKHSADPTDQSYIDVNIQVTNGFVHYTVVNTIPQEQYTKAEKGGLGLVNLQRRLQLMYGTMFYFNSSTDKYEYIATLKLPL